MILPKHYPMYRTYNRTQPKDHPEDKTTLLLKPQSYLQIGFLHVVLLRFQLDNENTPVLRPIFFQPNTSHITEVLQYSLEMP